MNIIKRNRFKINKGLYNDMNSIRRNEDIDNIHFIFYLINVKIIITKDRDEDYLKNIVKDIF